MVAEGLSNIRRHTQAMHVAVLVTRQENNLVLQIEDEGSNGATPVAFTPRSITERATALGGQVRVRQCESGGNAVVVEIPL
jgi:signal transduction histidine kinase